MSQNLFNDTFTGRRAVGIPPQRKRCACRHHHAMPQHLRSKHLHIVRQRITAPFHQRIRLHRAIKRLRAPWTHPQRQPLMRARPLDHRQHVIHDRLIHRDLFHRALQFQQFLAAQHMRHGLAMMLILLPDDVALTRHVGIPDPQPHQKPVQLRFRQRIRPMMIGRILRRDHHERLRQRQRPPFHCHLLFVHRLEQRRLRLRRRAIDLVGQQEVRKHRPRLELESLGMRVVNGHARARPKAACRS